MLLRRVQEICEGSWVPDIPRNSVLRVSRAKLLRPGELERAVELAARLTGPGGAILILLDADDDAPCELGPALLARARLARSDRRIAVVLAKREFEAWFIASAASLATALGLPASPAVPADPEAIRDAKGWVAQMVMPDGVYRETLQQAQLSALMSLDEAQRAPSFDKLVRDVCRLLEPAERTT